MQKQCPECQGIGFTSELDGDGYESEVLCKNCEGIGTVENVDGERNIREEN